MWRQDTIDNLKPRDKAYKVSENNLVVKVEPTGKKTYYAYINRKDKLIGGCSLISLKQARMLKDEKLHEVRIGKKEDSKLTFKEYIDTKDFLDWSVTNRTSHKERLESLNRTIIPFLGNLKLSEINQQAILRFVNHRTSKDRVVNSTIERNLTDIRAVLRCAYELGYIQNLIKIKSLNVDRGKEPRVLSNDEVDKLFNAITDTSNLSDYNAVQRKHLPLIVRIAIETGARKKEILSLTWGDIIDRESSWKEVSVSPLLEESEENDLNDLLEDFKVLFEQESNKGALTFRGQNTKTRQTRLVPISGGLLLMLKKYYERTTMLNNRQDLLTNLEHQVKDTKEGKILKPKILDNHKNIEIFPMNSIKTSFAKAVKRAKLSEDITFHCLRHTFCSRALDYMNIDEVKKLAGHADIKTTQQYLHLNKERINQKHDNYVQSLNLKS